MDDDFVPLDDETLAFAARIFDLARHGAAADLARPIDAGLPVDLATGKGDTLLMLASYNGNAAAVEALLERGADPDRRNDRGQLPLDGASFKGDLAVVQLLLAGGASVDGPDDGPAGGDGRTPLMVAAMFDRVEIARALLDAGADADRRDGEGLGVRDLAARMGAAGVPALLDRRQQTEPSTGKASTGGAGTIGRDADGGRLP